MVPLGRYSGCTRTGLSRNAPTAAQCVNELFRIGETNSARQKRARCRREGGGGRVTAPRGKGARGRPGREGGGPPPCGRLLERSELDSSGSFVLGNSIDWATNALSHAVRWGVHSCHPARPASLTVTSIANAMPSACLATSRTYRLAKGAVLPFRNRVDRVAMLCRSGACQGVRQHRFRT